MYRGRKPREVEVPDPTCQPNAEKLRQDLRPQGMFENVIKVPPALVRSLQVMPRKSLR